MRLKVASTFIRAQSVALHKNSKTPMTIDEVAKQLKASKKCIYVGIKRYEEIGEFIDKRGFGRSPKIHERDQRHLKRPVPDENRLSVNKVTRRNESIIISTCQSKSSF